ncbi:putative carboxylesterase nap [Paenibacillus aceti]|uniref:Carboxylesterase nap n=1 Tax=Paenibacillus aceti TaxID=1820010 RepID=A0ABQ1W3W9_9BACL|nr:putative carboxylesterase nap [Paenibacillus aceti]
MTVKVYRSAKAQKCILDTYNQLLALWDIDKEERDITTSYGTTHVIQWGKEDAPPLVLFHGVGDDSALMWIYNAKALGQHFRLYAIDTIGGPGKSVIGEKYDKTFDGIRWIDEVLAGLGLSEVKASFMGVSHGGYLVQLYTLHRPESVDKAISLAAAVPAGKNGNSMRTMMRIFLPEALFPTKNNIARLLRKLAGANYKVFTENPLIMEHYTWLLKGFNTMAMTYHKVRGFSDQEVKQLRDKVFYLVGLDDPFEKMGGAEALRAYDMNARFYEGAGHGINHEIADEINQMVIDIMQGHVIDLRLHSH